MRTVSTQYAFYPVLLSI